MKEKDTSLEIISRRTDCFAGKTKREFHEWRLIRRYESSGLIAMEYYCIHCLKFGVMYYHQPPAPFSDIDSPEA